MKTIREQVSQPHPTSWRRNLICVLAAVSFLMMPAGTYSTEVPLKAETGTLPESRDALGPGLSRRGEERGHIFVIDGILSDTVFRYEDIGDLSKERAKVIIDSENDDVPLIHGYYTAEMARLECLNCAITILNVRGSLLSKPLQQVLDFIRSKPAEQVIINISYAVSKSPFGFDIPDSEAIIEKLIATGRAVVVAATMNDTDKEHAVFYPAVSMRVITVGSLAHHGKFATKVDIVTTEYELDVGGVVRKGNSLAAPQISGLIGWIVREYRQLSVQEAAAIVLSTTNLGG